MGSFNPLCTSGHVSAQVLKTVCFIILKLTHCIQFFLDAVFKKIGHYPQKVLVLSLKCDQSLGFALQFISDLYLPLFMCLW